MGMDKLKMKKLIELAVTELAEVSKFAVFAYRLTSTGSVIYEV